MKYLKKFNESLNEDDILRFLYVIDDIQSKFEEDSYEWSSNDIQYEFDESKDYIFVNCNWSTPEEGGSENMKIYWKETPIRMEWDEYQSTVYGSYDNKDVYEFNTVSDLIKFFDDKYISK